MRLVWVSLHLRRRSVTGRGIIRIRSRSVRAWVARIVALGCVTVLAPACERGVPTDSAAATAPMRITAVTTGTPISTLVVEVTATDIPTPLVFNLTVVNGVASGTIRIPPGAQRTIAVTAFDDAGDITHEGSVAIDVKAGPNPPVNIPLRSRAGQVPIVVTFGNYSVVVTPSAALIDLGKATQLQLTVSVIGVDGQPIADPQVSWATTQPTLATVSSAGLVTGLANGTVTIVAVFEGVAGLSAITVTEGEGGGGAGPGTVTTVAGTGTAGFLDGVGTAAQFNFPFGVAVALDGSLYVADTDNHRIRRIDLLTGMVSTIAGDGTAGFADGIGTAARFSLPVHVAVANGTLFVVDNNRIRRIDLVTGMVSTIAGDGTPGFTDGVGTAAQFNSPSGVAVALDGSLYVTDASNHSIRRIELPTGTVTTVAGNGVAGFADGVGSAARFNSPRVAGVASDGSVYVADANNHSIRRFDPLTATVSTIAGSGSAGAEDGIGSAARFNSPRGGAVAPDGSVYVSDALNHRIRRIDPLTAMVSTVAGDGTAGFTDGVGFAARFNFMRGVAMGPDGALYVADRGNHAIRRVRFD